jgi:hypothetical protein
MPHPCFLIKVLEHLQFKHVIAFAKKVVLACKKHMVIRYYGIQHGKGLVISIVMDVQLTGNGVLG